LADHVRQFDAIAGLLEGNLVDDNPEAGQQSRGTTSKKRGGRQPLARHLTRERIVHDLAESEKHCSCCGKDLRLIEEETSEHYAQLRLALKRAGTPIPSNDLWIAALCRQHDFPVLSKDRHFDRVKGLRRVEW
jgi:hypothetical protein